MNINNYYAQTVGEIVAHNFDAAQVFHHYNIDFCCHGQTPFAQACRDRGLDPEQVVRDLDNLPLTGRSTTPSFSQWPLDLLVDYVLKIHHRNIRSQGPETAALLHKVVDVHGANHPELHEVAQLFDQALADLELHLQKEEQVLFPYVYEQVQAASEGYAPMPFHCGTIRFPIGVMEDEHSHEGERFARIAALTHQYEAPADACPSYRLALQQLHDFEAALHEHIHLENNLIFPRALTLEAEAQAAEPAE
ncbi:MAG: iron-sulfur cluster repair di-iron protein [Rothia sp. (in: high G+C Gram-positive bacteria)]|uniref:iron-sulfur cluster repair di-iron protein n=1 Tax=Rothia sp. (in: high G+C Gram-positive bacteria) TaxID=1885016 RepID=UPI0026DEEDBD|nr:iron-sulfur cluster repair di-iron protein [Rothia sp. (in: high G+C Gram-positive bacteria)]MDO5751389.1 iron-sulfur cluster repair di-iron protein [Rothia sp. (in: high G+C Gram-positive bacteria)]